MPSHEIKEGGKPEKAAEEYIFWVYFLTWMNLRVDFCIFVILWGWRGKNDTFIGNLAGKGNLEKWKNVYQELSNGVVSSRAVCFEYFFLCFHKILRQVQFSQQYFSVKWIHYFVCDWGSYWGAQREGPGDRWNLSCIYTWSPNLGCQGYFFNYTGKEVKIEWTE